MTRTPGTMHVLTETYRPVGGVVKIMDYVLHALDAGYDISIRCREKFKPGLPLFAVERFAPLVDDERVTFHRKKLLKVMENDLVFLSLPASYELAYRSLPRGYSPERLIHIIQNVRHTNPTWRDGQPVRLLTRPLARISINDIVADEIAPWLDPRTVHAVIPIGHDVDYFAKRRTGGLTGGEKRPLRVGHTTWKSEVGDRTAALLAGEEIEFRAIRDVATWADLRDLYHWSDVFLSTPGPQEGLYLPGVEAMAAGALVVTSDAGGNMQYCRPDQNCLLVAMEDEHDYARALQQVRSMPVAEVESLRAGGYAATEMFSMERERKLFQDYLEALWPRIEAYEAGHASTLA